MEIVSFDSDSIKMFGPHSFVGKGAEGRIYKYSNEEIIKIYYGFVTKMIDRKSSIPSELDEFGSRELSRILSDLILRSSCVKLTKLPTKIAIFDKYTIGGIGPYFDGYTPLNKLYFSLPTKDVLTIFRKVLSAVKELNENFIYPTDLNGTNILVSKCGEVELIDINSFCTYTCESADKYYGFESFYNILNEIIDYVFLKVPEDVSYEDAMMRLHLPIEFITYLSSNLRANYKGVLEVIEEISRNKKLMNTPVRRRVKKNGSSQIK